MTALEQQVKMKDKQIEKLTKLVKDKNGSHTAVLAISPEAADEEEEGYYDRGTKISRTEWLMAQVDLDPIESHGSMEMSTTKFKSMAGKKLLNSERGVLEDSSNTKKTAPAALEQKEKEKTKEPKSSKGGKSFESQFIDVSEDKMRNFVME